MLSHLRVLRPGCCVVGASHRMLTFPCPLSEEHPYLNTPSVKSERSGFIDSRGSLNSVDVSVICE